jgi:hypothetical protein
MLTTNRVSQGTTFRLYLRYAIARVSQENLLDSDGVLIQYRLQLILPTQVDYTLFRDSYEVGLSQDPRPLPP